MPRDNDSVTSDNDGIPKSTYEIYRAEADSLLRNDEFNKAAKSYTKALELRPGDRHCLVSRSKCYLRMDQTEEALKDVEESVKEDKDYYKGVLQKAEVLYFKGDFENALVYYHRGNKLRPELTEFRKGIQKAEEAINNSVGDSSVVLTCEGDLSYFYQHQEAEKGKKAKKPRGGYSKHKQVQEKKKVERKKSSMDAKTQKKLLGQLYNDVTFLNHMVKDEKHTALKTQNSEEINTLAIEALNFLESRTEFWQQQSPARANKGRDGRKGSGKDSASGVQPARYVLNSLEEIDGKQTNGNYDAALRQARQVMKHVDGWTEKDLANKQEVLANLHSIMGNCHLDLGQVDKALTNHERDLAIGRAHDLPDAVSRAMDNLGRCHAKNGDYEEAIKIWKEKIPSSQSGLESAWLLHEIGRCYLELGNFEESKKHGEDSLKHAQEIEDNSWMLNASVLVAQSEVKLKDYQGAIDTFERALDYAEVQNNKDAQGAIKKAIADINHQIVQQESEAQERDGDGGSDREEKERDGDGGSDREEKERDGGSDREETERDGDGGSDREETERGEGSDGEGATKEDANNANAEEGEGKTEEVEEEKAPEKAPSEPEPEPEPVEEPPAKAAEPEEEGVEEAPKTEEETAE